MKIAITTKGQGLEAEVDPRFGRAPYLLVFDDENEELITYDNTSIEKEAHGAGTKTAGKLFDLGADVLLTGNGPGGNAMAILEKTGVEIFTTAENMSAFEAIEAYKANRLKKF